MPKILTNPINKRILGFILATLLIIALFTFLNDRFFTLNNMTTVLRNLTPVGFASLGLTFVIIVQRFDLSFEGVISFGAMCVAFFITIGINPWIAVPLGLMCGSLIGLINGIAIAYFRLPDIVTTIAVGAFAGGASYLFSNGKDIFRNFFSSGILNLNNGTFLSISYATIFLIAVYAIVFVILHMSRWGRSFYASGENPIAAKYSGINVKLYVAAAFIISAILMTCASTVLISAGGKGEVGAGDGYMLASYAAVLLGAAIFSGPGVLPTIAGVLFIAIINNGLTLAGINNLLHNAIIAIILIVGVIALDHQNNGRLLRNFLFKRKDKTSNNTTTMQEVS